MKLLYIHGLSSSSASSTAKNLRILLPESNVIAPDLPVNPKEALSLLSKISKNESPDIIIGTSMGGMFAQQMHGFKKILVNPSFHVSEFMRRNIGIQPFLNTRQDGTLSYEITNSLCDEYLEVEQHQFEGITAYDKENTYALFGDKDEQIDCSREYLTYYEKQSRFSGRHRLTFDDVQKIVLPHIHLILKSEVK
ncbi:hypothetical protein LJB92_00670 [Bacteroidales bacterium OttesenSCG-928-M06]|nr:hypothetical protein [Bacteroidales bacterium OttesenSCG-928-M06]